jgi:hypothetical protein
MQARIIDGIIHKYVDINSNVTLQSNGEYIINNIAQPIEVLDEGNYDNQSFNGFDVNYGPRNFQMSISNRRNNNLMSERQIDHIERKYRFLGDLYTYKTHWLPIDSSRKYLAKIDKTYKYFKSKSNKEFYIQYICSDDVFNKKTDYLELEETEWDSISNTTGSHYNSLKNDESRIFCLGCAMKLKTYDKVSMLAINTENNDIENIHMDIDCVMEIKKLFKKSKYSKIEDFFANKDITLDITLFCEKTNKYNYVRKTYNVSEQNTIYKEINGEVNVSDHRYNTLLKIALNLYNYNSYGGELIYDKIKKLSSANKIQIDWAKRKVKFLDIRDNKIYHEYEIQEEIEDEENFFLEI